jgi:dyslexia susceptibility 1 candidate gene 1 protein
MHLKTSCEFHSQELSDERQQLQDWQSQLGGGGAASDKQQHAQHRQEEEGDESDYEEDLKEVGQLPVSEAAAPDCANQLQEQGGVAPEKAPPPSDHPEYYGRGWRPRQRDQGGGDSDDGDEKQAVAAAVHEGGEVGGSSSCDGDDNGVSAGGAAGGGDHNADSGCTSAEAVAAPAAAAPAPRRGSLAPVKVSFTRLETPHLPARQQREDKLRLHKKGKEVGGSAAALSRAGKSPSFLTALLQHMHHVSSCVVRSGRLNS